MIRRPRMLSRLLVSSVLTGLVAALDSDSPGFFSFSSCGDRLQCGHVVVPKNYASMDDGIAKISLSKIPATTLPSMGTVFVNPGGPGGSGATWAAGNIDYLVDHIGSQWDIVGFDPRGIGATMPQVHCFASQQDQINLYTGTVFEQGYTYPNMTFPTDPSNMNSLIQAEKQHLSVFKAHGEACKQNMDINDLRFMGSMTVARDVEFMSRVLDGDDSDINFYGYSYGTIIGAYLLNMFPDRIGRLTLDGVVDVIDVANTPTNQWANTFLVSQEATYQAFLSDCSKSGPSGCPLAQQTNENVKAIDARIERFTQSLVQQSLVVSNPAGSLTAGAIRNLFVNALYSPSSWPTFSAQLASAMSGDGSALLTALRSGISTVAQTDATRFAVICSDAPRWGGLTSEDYASDLAAALKVSRFAGGLIYTDPDGGCESWPVEPVERYTGPWNTDPKNPVLIISNTADPVTPLVNGRKAQERIASGKSALIIQDGPGHTSLALPSDCTKNNIRSYWAGNLPSDGTVCQLSGGSFLSSFKANFATPKKSAELVLGIKFIPF